MGVRATLGESLVFDYGAVESLYYRQSDGAVAHGRPLDLTFSSNPRRYGIATWAASKGNLVGEAFVADKVLDVIRHPSNPFNLARNATYDLTRQDRDDLKLMAIGGQPAYQRVLRMFLQLFPEEPPIPKPPDPPKPPVTPPIPPVTPPEPQGLEKRAEEVMDMLHGVAYALAIQAQTPFPGALALEELFGAASKRALVRPFIVAGLRLYRALLAKAERS